MNIFDRVSQQLLGITYTIRDLRMLAVTCYLVASKMEGIPPNSHFFSAEVAADIVKLGVSIDDIKETECRVLICLDWEFPSVFPTECCLFLFQAQKLQNWDGMSSLSLNLNSWIKSAIQELTKLSLEQKSCVEDFSYNGFAVALGCFQLIGKPCEQEELCSVIRCFLKGQAFQDVRERASTISAFVLKSAKTQETTVQAEPQPVCDPVKIGQHYSTKTQDICLAEVETPTESVSGQCQDATSSVSTAVWSANKPIIEQPQKRKPRSKCNLRWQQSPRCSQSEGKIRLLSFRLRSQSDSRDLSEACWQEYLHSQHQIARGLNL